MTDNIDNISTRPCTTADIPLLRRLAEEAFPHTYRDILSPDQLDYMMEWMYSADSLHRQMTEERHTFFVAERGAEPCGYVSVERQGEDLFHLQKIYVLPAAQGCGVGRVLFDRAVGYVRSVHPGRNRLELNVNRHNRARLFYERMGMKVLREGDFAIGAGYFMNDYIMGMEV